MKNKLKKSNIKKYQYKLQMKKNNDYWLRAKQLFQSFIGVIEQITKDIERPFNFSSSSALRTKLGKNNETQNH